MKHNWSGETVGRRPIRAELFAAGVRIWQLLGNIDDTTLLKILGPKSCPHILINVLEPRNQTRIHWFRLLPEY